MIIIIQFIIKYWCGLHFFRKKYPISLNYQNARLILLVRALSRLHYAPSGWDHLQSLRKNTYKVTLCYGLLNFL